MRIIWTPLAKEKISGMIGYYLPQDGGPKKIRKILDKIEHRVDLLVNHPRSGQREMALESAGREYRRVVVGNYKIIYSVDEEIVWIVDVWDCRMDPEVLRESVVGVEA